MLAIVILIVTLVVLAAPRYIILAVAVLARKIPMAVLLRIIAAVRAAVQARIIAEMNHATEANPAMIVQKIAEYVPLLHALLLARAQIK